MNTQKFIIASTESLLTSFIAVLLVAGSFFLVEPQVGQAVVGTPFTIKTTITDEISFLTQASNVIATGTINGLTGGTANGSTTVVVKTNNTNGYTMSIAFFNNGTANAMRGDVSASQAIRDYGTTASGTPDRLFSTASTSAVFAYTVDAADSNELDLSFVHDGANCDAGATPGGGTNCWMEPRTTDFQLINSSGPSNSSTSTIYFRIYSPNSPTPSLAEDIYTATATLTALNK